MKSIENSFFRDITADYGGAFFINRNINLFVKNVVITNVKTTSYFTSSERYDMGSGLCCSTLSANYRSLFVMHSASHIVYLNDTSLDNSACSDRSILFGKFKSFSKSVNCTHLKTVGDISTLHFGWHASFYYCTDIIIANNTGVTMFGFSCGVNEEQISNNIVFLDNNSTAGLLRFWRYRHRIKNSYMIGNSENTIVKAETCTVTFDNCFHDGITKIDTENNVRTYYENFINIATQNCLTLVFDLYVKRNTCQYIENHLTYLFIMGLIVI
jgi:hypothetical protein